MWKVVLGLAGLLAGVVAGAVGQFVLYELLHINWFHGDPQAGVIGPASIIGGAAAGGFLGVLLGTPLDRRARRQ